MRLDRREFMRAVGVALAGLTGAGCGAAACYVPLPPTPSLPAGLATPTEPTVSFAGAGWQRLRELWYSLDALSEKAKDLEAGQRALEELVREHEDALRSLVEARELNANVADEMQVAFSEAAWHVWRKGAPITCYLPAPYPDYELQGRSDLQRQAELLEEMAKTSQIDEATVAEARAAIERDLAYLTLAEEKRDAIRKQVMEAGDRASWPKLAEIELEIPPECREAAEILVALLLQRDGG
jgi:hypothetical protein